jgi:plastocyanin
MTTYRILTTSLAISIALLCAAAALTLPGCGDGGALGGGAKSEVNITIIPAAGAGAGGAGGNDVAAAGYGHLKGMVTIAGAAPSLGPLISASQVKPDDKDVCVVERIPNEKLVVHGGAVQNVFLYLAKKPAGTKMPDPAPAAVVMDHDTCTFKPHALVVLAGQPITVLNADAVPHNVHTYPQRSGSFNSGIPPKDRKGFDLKYVNAERQPVSVKCDFHTWMQAWHLPLDHPYGAVTNENGEFSIRDLPAGKHKFTVWHEGNTLREVEVTIEPDAEAELNLEIPAGEFKVSAAGGAPKSVVLSMAR